MTSFVSFDDNTSLGGSTFDLFSSASGKKSNNKLTPKRSTTRFDLISPSLTVSTTASRSKMNRAASICNINEHYDSFSSLNSKATMPIIRLTRPTTALFGGSLMNIPIMNNKTSQHSVNLIEDAFDLTIESPLSGSISSLAISTQGARSQTHLSTKSNKQTILNALKRLVLAGPANERQRDVVSRVKYFIFLSVFFCIKMIYE